MKIIRIYEYYFLVDLLLLFRISNQDALQICPIKSDPDNQFSVFLDGFKKFNELNFTFCTEPFQAHLIEIRPEKNLILDNSFDWSGLVINPISNYLAINFINLYGIEIAVNPINHLKFSDLNFNFNNIFIDLYHSNLNFFHNGKLLDQTYCTMQKFPKLPSSFVNKIGSLVLILSSIYSNEICPLLFHQVNLKLVSIAGIRSTLIEKNTFRFQTLLNYTDDIELDSKIFQVILSVYSIDLNTNILDYLIFKKLNSVDINGELNSIQSDLFKSFKELKMLRIRSQNIKKLFMNKNDWLNYLNYHVNIDLEDSFGKKIDHDKILFLVFFQTYSNVRYYNYPDKDFCYFKDFPHHRSSKFTVLFNKNYLIG